MNLTHEQLLDLLPEFLALYARRPFPSNDGGMAFNHSFALFATIHTLEPELIIESGIWRGHSTWLIEQAAPDTPIVCFDPVQSRIEHHAANATYHSHDFADHDWSKTETADALCLFDDHQNAMARLIDMRWWGFRHALFDDNFPCGRGDAYSLRKARSGCGHPGLTIWPYSKGGLKHRIRRVIDERALRKFMPRQFMLRDPNDVDKAALKRNLDVYYEFPPVLRRETTRWGDSWTGPNESEPALLEMESLPPAFEALRELADVDDYDHFSYVFMCYAHLR